ncbi:hypothetical protein ACFLWK_02135 [Chloroflexota bacterium]
MKKRRLVYLYLSLICFIGFIAVFFMDGYMGIYDTLYITGGVPGQKIEHHQWQRRDGNWTGSVWWGQEARFRYEISNREFSPYSADIEVSLWHSEDMVRNLVSQQMLIARFDRATIEWVVDTVALEPEGPPPTVYPYTYFITIKSNGIERELKLYITKPPSQVPG